MSLLTEYIRDFGRFAENARLYLISNALSGITVGIILVLYNLYLVSLGYAADFIGLVLFVGTIGVAIAIFPAGICVDRWGGKVNLIWSSVLIGIAGAGQILLRQPFPLLASAFLAGIGAAFLVVVNAPFLTLNSTETERSLLFSFNIVLSLATTVLGELLGGILPLWLRAMPWLMVPLPSPLSHILANQAAPRSYQLALLFAGLIAAPSFIPLFLISNDRPPSTRTGSSGPTLDRMWHVLTTIFSSLLRRRQKEGKESLQQPWDSIRFKRTLSSSLFVLVIMQLLIGMGAGLFLPYFNIYFVQHLKASSALFGLIDGGANTLNALLTLAAPLLVARIGKVNTITSTRLISLPLLLLIGFTGFLPLVAVLYLFRQGTMDMAAGIVQMFSMEVVPKQSRGLSNSSFQASYQIAWALAVPIGGLIIVHNGYIPVFILAACLYLVAILLFWYRFRRGEKDETCVETA